MAITTARIIRSHHKNNLFTLTIDRGILTTNITMKMLKPITTTSSVPQTYLMLKKFLPSILKSKCFNYNKYPFSREVLDTEIGHLFEHILLEYVCEQKVKEGIRNPVHSGFTQWDWEHDDKGIFYINIDIGHKDKNALKSALEKSIFLIDSILKSHEVNFRTESELVNYIPFKNLSGNKVYNSQIA